jgi:hypothetical protein
MFYKFLNIPLYNKTDKIVILKAKKYIIKVINL